MLLLAHEMHFNYNAVKCCQVVISRLKTRKQTSIFLELVMKWDGQKLPAQSLQGPCNPLEVFLFLPTINSRNAKKSISLSQE